MAGPWEKYKAQTPTINAGPWQKYKSVTQPPKTDAGFVGSQDIEGELPSSTRAAISFASSEKGKQGYLAKEFPGAEFAQSKEGESLIKLPGEQKFRYYDKPGFSAADIADVAGDLPATVGGFIGSPASVPGAATGAVIGELAKKAIGRGLIGIPEEASFGDVKDIALAGALGAGGQKLINVAAPYAKPALGTLKNIVAEDLGGRKIYESAVSGFGKGVDLGKKSLQTLGLLSKKPAKKIAKETELSGQSYAGQELSRLFSPKTTKELIESTEKAVSEGNLKEPLSHQKLKEALVAVPDLQIKPLDAQVEALKSGQTRDLVSVFKNLPSRASKALQDRDQLMKQEAQDKLSQTIKSIGKRDSLPIADAGQAVMDSVKSKYDFNRQMLAPVFDQYKSVVMNKAQVNPGLKQTVAESIPSLSKFISTDDAGNIALQEFTPKMGITKSAHADLKQALESLNGDEITFKDMQNIREFLRQSIDPVNPKATKVLEDARGAMLDYMHDLMQRASPNADVRNTFKQFAVNEKNLNQMEQIFGGKIESFDQLLKAQPEKILPKIFRDSNTIKVAKNVMDPEQLRAAAADYVQNIVERTTRDNFSSNAFNKEFSKALPQLKEVLMPHEIKRIASLNDIIRFVPDLPTVNPSGTAKAMQIGSDIVSPSKLAQKLGDIVTENISGRRAEKKLTSMLQKKGGQVSDASKGRKMGLLRGFLQSEASGFLNQR